VDALGLDSGLFGVRYIRYPLLAGLLLLITSASHYLLERPIRSFRKHFA